MRRKVLQVTRITCSTYDFSNRDCVNFLQFSKILDNEILKQFFKLSFDLSQHFGKQKEKEAFTVWKSQALRARRVTCNAFVPSKSKSTKFKSCSDKNFQKSQKLSNIEIGFVKFFGIDRPEGAIMQSRQPVTQPICRQLIDLLDFSSCILKHSEWRRRGVLPFLWWYSRSGGRTCSPTRIHSSASDYTIVGDVLAGKDPLV